jgi:hypothetical protein
MPKIDIAIAPTVADGEFGVTRAMQRPLRLKYGIGGARAAVPFPGPPSEILQGPV